MSSLRQVAIGDALRLTSGFPFESRYFTREEGQPLIRIRDIATSSVETRYCGPFSQTYVVRSGDVLVSCPADT